MMMLNTDSAEGASDKKDSKSKINTENGESEEENSSDSLMEIRLNEVVRKSELSDFDIRALVVRCSACGHQLNHFSFKEVKVHRKLGVITCRECYEFYGSSEFSQDDSGYNYCTWCGNGGKLIVCDYCPNGFCSACIRRNFGRAEISVTNQKGWKCYCCESHRLKPKVNFCNFIRNYKENNKKEKKVVSTHTNGNSFSEGWLQTVFDDCDDACKNFHKKMTKLKSIEISKSKSLKHIVKKMEDLINHHKGDLKNIATSLSKRYESHIEFQLKAEQKSKNEASSLKAVKNGDSTVEKGDIDCVILDDDSKSKNDADVLLVGDSISKNDRDVKDDGISKNDEDAVNDSLPSTEPTQDISKSNEEKIQAKLLLLKSSSESDCENKEQPSDKEVSFIDNEKSNEQMDIDKSNEQVDVNKSDKQMDIEKSNEEMDIDDNVSDNSESIISNKKSVDKKAGVDTSKPTAMRKLSFTFSDSSNDDFNIDKPDFQAIEKVLEQKSENESLSEKYDPETDPKLKLQTEVILTHCDNLFKDGETYVKISNDSDSEAKLDKLVDRLCKLPTARRSKPQEKKKSVSLTKAAAKQVLLESSSSISLSSEEDEDQKKIVIGKKPPVKDISHAKKSLDSSDSSISDLSSESEVEKKKKKSKVKKNSDDSSDDFVPVRKKKYDKLLHAPLLSDEEKKPREKKEKKGSRKRKVLSSEDETEKKKSEKSEKSSDTTTSSEDEKEKKRQRKKRRRIKKIGSSSDEVGDEDDGDKDESQENTPGKGRKNIRKIVSQKKLAVTTKEAQLEEKERKKRIQERQKLYNKIEDMSVDGKEIVTRKMVLEVDQDSKEEIVEINPDLVCKLKPHQVNGVKFMWECTIESVKDLNEPGSGCILAHCMGLGKTLQVITFLHTCLSNPIVNKVIKRCMIICPYNVALNWATEFDYWLEDVEYDVKVHQLTSVKSNLERLYILEYWFKEGGVIILSYDIFRRLASGSINKMKKAQKTRLAEYLLDPGPDIVVCDEGHVLKNEKSGISLATSKLRTRRRIVLTGTPLQNNLKEYHCMLSFVKPNLLGTVKEFRNRFVNPIINGQYDDSNEYDVKLMKKRIHILHKLLEGCVQRCDYSALTKFLPTKHEFVISVKLSETQIKMYECYLENLTTARRDLKVFGGTLFVDFNNLRCIWTHPYICHVSFKRQEYKKMFKEDEEEDENFINDASEESSTSSSQSDSASDDDKLIEKIKKDNKTKDYRTRSKAAEMGEEEEEEEMDDSIKESKQWYHEFISDEDKYNFELSGKMVLLLEILKECETIGDKIILFSQSLLTLDTIEDILEHSSSQAEHEKTDFLDAHGTWVKGIDYFRMDGETSADLRKRYIDMFNNPSNDRSRLFLISTRAGSLGTNLVGANRVILFDTSWNPSHDVQAIFRVYRFGQVKPVYIYRLIAQGTMEEKIYDRQVTKLSLSCRVVDEQQIDRHFSAADLAELYTFDPNSTTNRPTPMVPKDRLLAELLIRSKEWIVTYHEHDSLLQNQTEEDLTEEERQAAWTEYENEREGRLPETNSGLASFDINKDIDFSQDYEGKKLPDTHSIITGIYEKLKAEYPLLLNTTDFKRRVLRAVGAVRQVFQEKHVKVLRLKQEYCTRGTVPNAVNKYMEELTEALRSTGDYIAKLSQAIQAEEAKLYQANMSNATRAPQPQFNPVMMQRIRQAMMKGQMPPGVVFRGINPNIRAQGIHTQRAPYIYVNRATYGRGQSQRQPKITEVDENAPQQTDKPSDNSKKSSVTIEEIT